MKLIFVIFFNIESKMQMEKKVKSFSLFVIWMNVGAFGEKLYN